MIHVVLRSLCQNEYYCFFSYFCTTLAPFAGVLAATMMSAVLLLLLAVVSPCVILGKGWVRGGTGIRCRLG